MHRSPSARPAARTVLSLVSTFFIGLIALLPSGCRRSESDVPAGERAAWTAKLLADRAATDSEMKSSPTSPMAGASRVVLKAPDSGWIVPSPTGVSVATEAVLGSPLSFTFRDGWRWDGSPAKAWREEGGAAIAPGAVPDGALFRVGRFTLATYASSAQLVVIVFDPEREAVKRFSHLLYFAPDPEFAVRAAVERITPPEPVTLLTSRNLEKRYFRYARLHFRLGGESCTLAAFKAQPDDPADTILFVPFADRTSGAQTYGAGRFLEIPEPPGDTLEIDFNRAFNPLCNYSPAYNCPIPPAENRLPVAVRAGEKTYPH